MQLPCTIIGEMHKNGTAAVALNLDDITLIQ